MWGVMFLVVIGTSIWVGIDASSIGAGKVGTGPIGWFLFCLLLWIVGFPVYLAKRSGIKATAWAASDAAVSTPSNTGQVPLNPPPLASGFQIPTGQAQPVGEGITPVFASKADELGKLDALRQSGALSQEEFDAEKAKVLGTPFPPVESG
jgi:hypothetical protein